jgi:hypothetical protein
LESNSHGKAGECKRPPYDNALFWRKSNNPETVLELALTTGTTHNRID